MQNSFFKILASFLIVGSLLFNVANAHKGATGITKERMDTMSSMGKSIGVLIDMIKGKTAYNADAASKAAHALQNHSDAITGQYPDNKKSRANKHTQALPAVWTQREKFDEMVDTLRREVARLNNAAKSKNFADLRPQIGLVAKSCSACHEKFRKPK